MGAGGFGASTDGFKEWRVSCIIPCLTRTSLYIQKGFINNDLGYTIILIQCSLGSLVAFAPKAAEIGDLVCQFERCNFLIILRNNNFNLNDDGEKLNGMFQVVRSARLIEEAPSIS